VTLTADGTLSIHRWSPIVMRKFWFVWRGRDEGRVVAGFGYVARRKKLSGERRAIML